MPSVYSDKVMALRDDVRKRIPGCFVLRIGGHLCIAGLAPTKQRVANNAIKRHAFRFTHATKTDNDTVRIYFR
jgi:hypothetical protein